jgi:sarcosine oxidase subunit beta
LVDYVIIGAGVYGVATAWWLARGGASVRVLECGEVAGRASGGPGRRGVRANGRDVRELALMRVAYEIWPGLHQELGTAAFYERTGQLLLAETDRDCERARAQAWVQQQQGIDTEILDAGALREREPGLSPAVRLGLLCPLDGVADHGAVTRAYAAAAGRLGVAISTRTPVAAVEIGGGRAVAVRTAGGERIEARHGVFVLGNATVRDLLAPWLRLPVWNECLQVLISEPLDPVPLRHLTGHFGRTVALKPEGADRVMISGGWPGHWDAGAQAGSAIPGSVAGNMAEAAAVYPALSGVAVEVADANHLESFSVDGIPIIDTLPGIENLRYATGWCGHGWAIAPVVARELAQWASCGRRPALLQPFALSRLG